jgi:hypothetical protein
LPDGDARTRMMNDYNELRKLVGPPGASDRTAELMVENLRFGAQNKLSI